MTAVWILPRNKPCTRCRVPIKAPLWSESEGNWIHFVWKCTECGNQFRTTGVFDLLQRAWFERDPATPGLRR